MDERYDVLVVGAGLSGIVVAERLASVCGKRVLVIDSRDHVGGNCYDYIDAETGIRVNKYGAHLFHTNDEEVVAYIQRFSEWVPWEHRVVALCDGKYVPVPVNTTTINQLCGAHLVDAPEMTSWLDAETAVADRAPRNSQDVLDRRVGPRLSRALFEPYTFKQWGKTPAQLAPEVLQRIPVRCGFDPRYFSDRYQLLPKHGYTAFFDAIVARTPGIDVRLRTPFEAVAATTSGRPVVYTGPIDRYFGACGEPKLEYRSINFHVERYETRGFFQPNSVVNHPSASVPYTRSVEYKHFLNQASDRTIVVHESTTDSGDPYYPVPTERNRVLFARYQALAKDVPGVHFVGRLGTYKYLNMDQAIRAALDFAGDRQLWPCA